MGRKIKSVLAIGLCIGFEERKIGLCTHYFIKLKRFILVDICKYVIVLTFFLVLELPSLDARQKVALRWVLIQR